MSAASIAGQVNEQFDLSSYVPPDVQADVSTGAALYQSFSTATQGVTMGPHGTIQLSDGAKQAILQGMAGAAVAAVPGAGAAIAAAIELYALAPKAGSGPGVCATDPPAGSSPLQLTAWPSFHSWASFNGSYGPNAPNSFEAFANPILEYNWLLGANCFSNLQLPADSLLASLIIAWNARHSSSVKRTVTRQFDHISSFGTNPNYDPIADALYDAIVGKYNVQVGSGFPTYEGPDQAVSSFVINDGPIKVAPLVLHLPTSNTGATMTSAPAPSASAAPPSVAKKVAVASLIVAAAGAAGIGVWALVSHQSYLNAAKSVWKASGGKLVAKVNPLPLSAEEASKSTSVQSLLFPRDKFSTSSAKNWAHKHGYLAYKTDVTEQYIRIRQRPPYDFKKGSFRTISLGNSGVRAVVARRR